MDPPIIIIQPMSMIVDLGSDVTFSVTATSEDNVLTYQWFKNGVIIDSATDSTFQIIGATGENEGIYTVEVSNSLNLTTTSSDATLTISKWVNYAFKTDPLFSRSILVNLIAMLAKD